MRLKFLFLIFAVCFLAACAPKFNYLNTSINTPEFDRIVAVYDYLYFVDDVGKLFDYPEGKNLQQIKALQAVIQSNLSAKGFNGEIEFALRSSGLGLNPSDGFEHYVSGRKRDALIYPPFYFESTFNELVQNQLIQSFADAQDVAFVPVSKKTQTYFNQLLMNSLDFNAGSNLTPITAVDNERVGILHIRAVLPKVSFMKAMGVSMLSVGLTAGATGGAFIGIATPVGVSHSTGMLFDNRTGEVVWKNQARGDLSQYGIQAQARFFKEFPALSR